MAKAKTVFFCKECGNESSKWLGQCPACKHFIDNKLINLVDCRFLARQFGSVITLQIHNRIKRRNSIINI